MELRVLLSALRRNWWILVLLPVIAGASAFAVSQQMTPTYRATATLFVHQAEPGTIDHDQILASERLSNTYAQIAQRRAVLRQTVERLGLPYDDGQLAGKISVSPVRDTQLIRVSAEDADPRRASDIANVLAQVFIDDELTQAGTVSLADEAVAPASPVRPNTSLNVILGSVLGLLVAGGLVYFREYLDDTIKDADDVRASVGLPALGTVPRYASRDRRRAATSRSYLNAAEAFRQVRTNVHFLSLERKLRTMLVTSAYPGEGKSTVAANLAYAFAQAGDRVIIVDADLRRPSLHEFFDVPNTFGLTGLLLSNADTPHSAVIATDIENLAVIPSGPQPPNPSELLASARMDKYIAGLRQMADYVIFDSPAALAVTDANLLSSKLDATILVAAMGTTRSQTLGRTVETLRQAGSKPVGVVINLGPSQKNVYLGSPSPATDGRSVQSANGTAATPANGHREPPESASGAGEGRPKRRWLRNR